MNSIGHLDWTQADTAWNAFVARDRDADGRFVVAVRTTGIYCKPSCPARRPKRANVEFFSEGAGALQAGYRPCKRCLPNDVSREAQAVSRAVALIEGSEERLSLDDLAARVGYAPHHFQRLFTRSLGVSPAAYGRQMRARRLERSLKEEKDVTDAVYAAGYEGPAGAYADAGARFGMTPGARRKGGAGERIRFAIAETSLGNLLVAATDKGLCRISFDEGEAELRAHFPNAVLAPPDPAFEALVREVVASVDDPARSSGHLPLDVRGTAFQEAVWRALRAIPPGETRSYAQVAAEAGRPKAVRAAGSACGDNRLAVLIPCHRVLRGDGGLGGYAWGLERKRALLAREEASGTE